MDVGRDERLAKNLDQRNRGADARLEAKLDALLGGDTEDLRSPARDQLLVRGDDRLARPEQLEHVVRRGLDTAHHLGDERNRGIAADRLEVGRQEIVAGGEGALTGLVANERTHDADAMSRRPLDLVAVFDQETVDGRSDRPVAKQRDRDVNRGHRHGPGRTGAPRA